MAENKTAPSRRRFLRTGGLAALFGFASAATVTHAAQHGASVSPALADLIEKHRAAVETLRAAKTRHAEAEAIYKPAANAPIPFDPGHRGCDGKPEPLTIGHGLERCVALASANIHLLQGMTKEAVSQLSPSRRRQVQAALNGMRKDIAKAIGDAFERAEAARVSSGLLDAGAQLENAEAAERDALAVLCAFKCASLADVNARAEYLVGLDGISNTATAAAFAAPLAVGEA